MAIPETQFRSLIQSHQRMVFSLALRLLGDYETAEEVAQDVFLELYRSGERLESEDHIRFWHDMEEGFRGRKLIDDEFLQNHRGDAVV